MRHPCYCRTSVGEVTRPHGVNRKSRTLWEDGGGVCCRTPERSRTLLLEFNDTCTFWQSKALYLAHTYTLKSYVYVSWPRSLLVCLFWLVVRVWGKRGVTGFLRVRTLTLSESWPRRVSWSCDQCVSKRHFRPDWRIKFTKMWQKFWRCIVRQTTRL